MSAALQAADAAFHQALALHQMGRLADAQAGYRAALSHDPRHFDALHLLGVLHAQGGDAKGALALIDQALTIEPDSVAALINRGNALKELSRPGEALASYDSAIAHDPRAASAHNNRGTMLKELRRWDEALAAHERAIALKPDYAEAHNNRATVLQKLDRLDEALAAYDRAVALMPASAELQYNRGTALETLGRYDEALAAYDRAIALKPDHADAHCNRGAVLFQAKRNDEALAAADAAIRANPRLAKAHANRGLVLERFGRPDEAIAAYDRAVALDPSETGAACGSFMVADQLCDWRGREAKRADLVRRAVAGETIVPFVMLTVTDDCDVQGPSAAVYTGRFFPAKPALARARRGTRDERIRIGYVSGDYRSHPVASLVVELFELHDRDRFELHGISLHPSDNSALRARIEAAFTSFTDMQQKSDEDIARFMAERGIDIAVDLTGYTQEARPGIFAYRPTPLAVSYLGYPGTTGADYIDYVIADRYVIPEQSQRFYSERVAYLPDAYQANDSKRAIAEPAPTRAQAGLPERGFVFCCFNNNYKITPESFDLWMRLLIAVPDSVLWLYVSNERAIANLVEAARVRGVAPQRLVFARRMDSAQHLSRTRLADLFLDTPVYNAHTTASDALWAGVPLVTCSGNSFASRVAGSLLSAAGLPELITRSMAQYEAVALRLARDPEMLAGLRHKLAVTRDSCKLFDSDRYRRHIEAAYATMWRRHVDGLAPQSFAVSRIG